VDGIPAYLGGAVEQHTKRFDVGLMQQELGPHFRFLMNPDLEEMG